MSATRPVVTHHADRRMVERLGDLLGPDASPRRWVLGHVREALDRGALPRKAPAWILRASREHCRYIRASIDDRDVCIVVTPYAAERDTVVVLTVLVARPQAREQHRRMRQDIRHNDRHGRRNRRTRPA